MSIDCDVLVVGGGPAGCSAAAAAAKQGLDTVLIEEDEEIGKPVKCAEGIGSYLIPLMPFDIPDRLLEWRIEGMEFHTADISVKRKGGLWKGWSIDREKWDKWVAGKASSNGVEIMKDTKLVSIDKEGKYNITGAQAEKQNETIDFNPKYVIAADGPNSTVAKLLGLPVENFVNAEIISYEVTCEMENSRFEYVFFGDFAPQGYGYIFPKSESVANVGVGGIGVSERKMRDFFEKFVESKNLKDIVRIKNIGNEKSGKAPIYYPNFEWNYGNIFFVGDAANQPLNPFVEGNIPSMICGWALGKNLEKFYKEKGKYREFVEKLFMGIYSESKKISKIFETLTPEKSLALFSDFATADKVSKMNDPEAIKLIRRWEKSQIFRTKEKLISKFYQYLLKIGFYINRRRL